MLFWTFLALMTAAAAFAVLWPLGHARTAPASAHEADHEADLAVYRDQLSEIERDRARGLLGTNEAEAARIEVSRRLLAADAAPGAAPASGAEHRRRITAIAAIAIVPALALGLYLSIGSPGLPDAPLAARLTGPAEQQDAAILVRRIEAHLADNPSDGRGWELLAPVYLGIGRYADAVRARTNARDLLGATADREAGIGEALVASAQGVVTQEARTAFDRAVALDRANPKALFFLGLAEDQDGKPQQAIEHWRKAVEAAAPDNPWHAAARRQLERRQADVRGSR